MQRRHEPGGTASGAARVRGRLTDATLGIPFASGQKADSILGLTAPSTPGDYLLLLDVVTPERGSLVALGADPTLVRDHGRRARLDGPTAPQREAALRSPGSRSAPKSRLEPIDERLLGGLDPATGFVGVEPLDPIDLGELSAAPTAAATPPRTCSTAAAGSRSPSTAQAWTTLPPFWTIEPSAMVGAVGSIGVPVSSSNSRRATAERLVGRPARPSGSSSRRRPGSRNTVRPGAPAGPRGRRGHRARVRDT